MQSDLLNNYSYYISYAALLVGILAALFTVVICWQVINYAFIKKEMKNIVDSAMLKSQKDLQYIMKGVIYASNSKAFLMSRFAQSFDDNMIALETILKSGNEELNTFAVDIIFDNLMKVREAMKNKKHDDFTYYLYEEKKSLYEYLLGQIEHKCKSDIMNMINESKLFKQNRNDSIRLIAENSMDELT